MSGNRTPGCVPCLLVVLLATSAAPDEGEGQGELAGTAPLTLEGDIASRLVAGVDRFLLRQLERSIERRGRHWKRDRSSHEAYAASIAPNRARLRRILGVRDPRVPYAAPELIVPASGLPRTEGGSVRPRTSMLGVVGSGEHFVAYAVRWPVIRDVTAEGLLLVPDRLLVRQTRSDPGVRRLGAIADVVALPDAGQTPEMIAGLVEGVPPESQYARRLAEIGCRVLIPTLIDRRITHRKIPNREFLYRSAFELGRHLIGYEAQKVLAGVDWFAREAGDDDPRIGVIGWGEGGLLALHAGALDERIDVTCVSGHFDSRQEIWREPLDRNVFGLLDEFGDAEIASLIAPRALVVEAARAPDVVVPPGTGAAPARTVTPEIDSVRREVARARELTAGLEPAPRLELIISGDTGSGPFGTDAALETFLDALGRGSPAVREALRKTASSTPPRHLRADFDPGPRHARQMHELDRHNQQVLRDSASVRAEFFKRLDTSSLERYAETIEWYRDYFRDEVIGRFDLELSPANPRSRRIYDDRGFIGYEVVLDVFEDVIAYGILLVPRGIADGERRPVVVCQHGLEGRPQDVADPSRDHPAYHQYAAKLARRGFVTFSPQNLYIFGDRFRTLQRKANPIKKTLFSVMVPQHHQITDWLAGLPFVDPERIGFYGLSYGGKSAMRIPPLVDRYCLSICSADFNEWVDKNASTHHGYSYVWTGEYEIFEFDLGSTFNYAEMAALICPRPFMVERGHFDGVASDETVAWEFARVRRLYAAKLGIGDRCEIEWFVGPHTINGRGTFEFLERHLAWPREDR